MGEIRVKRCQRPEDHRPHEPYVEHTGGADLSCPGGPAADLELVAAAAATIAAARGGIDEAVRRARANGRSWAAIGEVLGVSRQAAWERFHALEQDVAS